LGQSKHVREKALKLLTELCAVALETKAQFLIEATQLAQSNDARIAGTDGSETVLVRA